MAYTLGTVRNRVVDDKLDDTSYEPAIVNRFINDAQRAIFNTFTLPFMEKVFVGTLPIDEYIFEFPADFQMAQSLVLGTPEDHSIDVTDYYVPFRDFNSTYTAPALSPAGTPRVWTTYGDKLYFGQRTNGEYTLSLYYIKTPTELTDDAHIPDLPPEFEEVLVLGAYYRVLQRNEDYDLAAAVKQEYEEAVGNMVRRLGPRQTGTPHVMAQPLRSRSRRRR